MYDARVNRLLTDAARELTAETRQFGVGKIGEAQGRQAIVVIQQTLSYLWQHVGDTIRAGRADAAKVAVEKSFDWDRALFRVAVTNATEREALKTNMVAAAIKNVEASLARVYKSYIPLAEQVYRTRALADGWVDSRVTKELAKGSTVDELAKEVRDFVDPNTKGGAAYAARRLARSEINNAYHAVTIVHNEDKPWVSGMIWELSKSHPEPDICNVYADKSPYPRGSVPRKPHPQCLCFTYPETVSNDDFFAAFNAGEYDDWFEANE